jgi:PucR family transcriptional regulator, purine catabolism regulatory protein
MLDLLSDPVVRRGDPIVLSGADLLDRPLRWLHSSDIYEIAPLLRDGDMLLTTGLGLEGRSEAERRAYVRQLAARGVSGFALELCRFFTAAPTDMVEEAERLGLPMIGFRALVPFVEVTEAVNSAITEIAVRRLRRVDEVSRGLSEVLADEGGVDALLARLAAVLDRPVTLTGPRGEVVANVGHEWARSLRPDEKPGHEPLTDRAPVVLHGAVWGWLHTRFGDGDRLAAQAALERAAEIVSLGVLRGDWDAASPSAERRRLVAALLSGRGDGEGLRARVRAAGLPLTAAGYVVALVSADDPAVALAALDRAAWAAYSAAQGHGQGASVSPPIVTAEAEGICCTLLAGTGSPRSLAAYLSAKLADALPISGIAAVGPPVLAIEELVHSATEARLVLRIARRVAPRTRVADAAMLGAERALLRAYDVDGLARYVREQLGPLIDSDECRGTRLVDTLETVLTATEGKAEAARRLHLRRQTLYQRLRRIGELLDADLDEPRTRGGLLMALRARDLLGEDTVQAQHGRTE